MEKDLHLASKNLYQIVWRLRMRNQGSDRAALSWGAELLTRTEDIVRQWKQHFEELLNPTDTSSREEAELEVLRKALSISLVEVSEVVKKLSSDRTSGIDEIGWNASCHMEIGHSTCGLAD